MAEKSPLTTLIEKISARPTFYRKVRIADILIDTEHPSMSSEAATMRHAKSFERVLATIPVVGQIMVPVVISEREDAPGKYWLVDGWTRCAVAAEMEKNEIDAMILPPLTLLERITARIWLNNQQDHDLEAA